MAQQRDATHRLRILPPPTSAAAFVIDASKTVFDGAKRDICLSAPSISPHVCKICGKAFRASSLLDIHMRVHVGAKPFVCPICRHRATQKGNLKLHMKKHHGANLPPHIDLVPDSGIWGHAEELVLTAGHISDDEGCKVHPGRRKQVTQAVSSLFDEEIVGLIKKYQNSFSHLAVSGTVTESLEHFIRIASRNRSSNVPQEFNSQRSNRGAFSINSSALPIHDEPYNIQKKGGVRPTTSFRGAANHTSLSSRKSSSGDCCLTSQSANLSEQRLKPFAQVSSGNLYTAKSDDGKDLRNDIFFILERNRRSGPVCYEQPDTPLREKYEFLSALHLAQAKSKTKEKLDERGENEFTEGVDPLLTDMMAIPSLNTQATKAISNVKEPIEKKKTQFERKVAVENKVGVSCDVITKLRKSLSNSDVGWTLKCEYPEISSRDSFSYHNPAMQNLAKIGRILSQNDGRSLPVDLKNFAEQQPCANQLSDCSANLRCTFCSKRFKYRSVLQIHLRCHTGERPYKCVHCEYAGTQHNCLKLHIQRHHQDKLAGSTDKCSNTFEQFSESKSGSCSVGCPICGRISPSLGYLKIHMRSHKKRLNHVCHICGRGFKEYWYLSTHLKTHQRELCLFQRQTRFHTKIGPFTCLRNACRDIPSASDENITKSSCQIEEHIHEYAISGKLKLPITSSSTRCISSNSYLLTAGAMRESPTSHSEATTGSRKRKSTRPSRVILPTLTSDEFAPRYEEIPENSTEIVKV